MSEEPLPPNSRPGWYVQGDGQRYWDGTSWTDGPPPRAAEPPTPARSISRDARNLIVAAVVVGLVLFVVVLIA
jgi:hypothetical protein